MYKLIIFLNQKKYNITIAKNQNILNTVLSKNLEPPYSCESGSCGLCKAKLISGNIDMQKDDALNDDDLESNYILTCQSFLKKDSVISYDDVNDE